MGKCGRFCCKNVFKWVKSTVLKLSYKKAMHMLIIWENFGSKLFLLLMWKNLLRSAFLSRFIVISG